MKIRIKETLIFVATLLMVSCNLIMPSNDDGGNEQGKTIEVFPDSVKQHLMAQDSLTKQLVLKVDSITKELNNANNSIEKLQASLKELRAPGRILIYVVFMALLLSIISIIVVYCITRKKVDKWGARDAAKNYIEDPNTNLARHISRIEFNINDLNKKMQSANSSKSDDSKKFMADYTLNEKIEAEINKRRMSGKSEKADNTTNQQLQESTTFKSHLIKNGYAPIHTGGKYFVDIVDSRQESSVYSLTFTSNDSAEFDIISLDKIKSINDRNDIIELAPGSCLLEEASNYIVKEKGLCKRIDENTWEVIKKLNIKVSK